VRVRRAQGFALIDLIFVCGIIGLLASIALPRLLAAQQSAGAASAIGTMRAINSAQLTYALTCGSGFYAPDLPTLGVTPPGTREPFIASGLSTATVINKAGYVIQMTASGYAGSPPSCNGVAAGAGGQGFVAGADPDSGANFRFFATNANNVIYESTASLYATMPEVGTPPAGAPLK
jgi:type II secretory pathway pseudopilin PulG